MNLPERKAAGQRQAVSMTYEQALDIIGRAQRDKYLARELDALREQCCEFVFGLMNQINEELVANERKVPALLRNRDETTVSLRSEAARRVARSRQRRNLAEAMVVGALINSDNPGWNPLDPATHLPDRGGLLMALLKTSKEWMA